MAIGPFVPRLDEFDEVFGYNLNWVVDFLNNFTDYSGVLSLQLTNAHLAITGTAPTLGSLQTGVSAQSITGNDSFHIVSITTTGSPPAVGGSLFVVTYANAWTNAPGVILTVNAAAPAWAVANPSATTGYTAIHGGTSAGVAALQATSTYKYAVIAMGAGSA